MAEQQRASSAAALEAARETQAKLESQRGHLARDVVTAHAYERRLDELGPTLLGGTSHVVLDALLCEVDVLRALQQLVPTEVRREQRAQAALKTAEKELVFVIKMVREMLELALKNGLSNDNRDRLVPGSLLSLVKQYEPRLLRAKNALAAFYTLLAKARLRQKFVDPAPTAMLLDMSKLPGKRADALDGPGLLASIETSYGQFHHLQHYVRHEIATSQARERELRAQEDVLVHSVAAAQQEVRAARAAALAAPPAQWDAALARWAPLVNEQARQASLGPATARQAARGTSAAAAEAQAALQEDVASAGAPPPSAARSDAGSLTAWSLSVADPEHMPPKAAPHIMSLALGRLRVLLQKIADDTRTDPADEEDLPWTMLALGF